MALAISTGLRGGRRHRRAREHHAHIEEGMKPPCRRPSGAAKIGFTVLSMSMSLVAVFIPLLLMGGMRGPPLPRVCGDAGGRPSLVSLVVSLTTTPMMCARLLRRARRAASGLYRGDESASSVSSAPTTGRSAWALAPHGPDAGRYILLTSRLEPCYSTSSCPRASSRSRTPAG